MTANGSVVESSKSSLIGSPSARLKLQTFVSHRVNSPRTPKDEIEVMIENSYDLVVDKLSKKDKRSLNFKS